MIHSFLGACKDEADARECGLDFSEKREQNIGSGDNKNNTVSDMAGQNKKVNKAN